MRTKYCVIELKTGVVLTVGSYKYCEKWVSNNCKYNEKYGLWKDADGETVTIIIL